MSSGSHGARRRSATARRAIQPPPRFDAVATRVLTQDDTPLERGDDRVVAAERTLRLRQCLLPRGDAGSHVSIEHHQVPTELDRADEVGMVRLQAGAGCRARTRAAPMRRGSHQACDAATPSVHARVPAREVETRVGHREYAYARSRLARAPS
jgi:hypothetical protein